MEKTIQSEDCEMEMMQDVKPALCMAATFIPRRRKVTTQIPKISDLLQEYPELSFFEEIRMEFQRITGKNTVHFETLFVKMVTADRTLHKSCPLKCRQTESTCVLPNPFISPHEVCVTEAEIRAFLCDKTKGKWQNKIVFYGSEAKTKRLQPIIIFNQTDDVESSNHEKGLSLYHWNEEKANICCENVKILSKLNLYETILASYYLYYVFHLEYVGKVDEHLWIHFDRILRKTADKKYFSKKY